LLPPPSTNGAPRTMPSANKTGSAPASSTSTSNGAVAAMPKVLRARRSAPSLTR
jgi:hypothetical protein